MAAATASRRTSGPVIRSISPSGRSQPYTSSPFGRSTPSVRFSIDNRPISPSRSISAVRSSSKSPNTIRRTCMCSPTTHPGSFRCSLHKNNNNNNNNISNNGSNGNNSNRSSWRLNARRSAMTNSLVRIGTVEGEIVKRALTALIRPSSHHQRRRGVFNPKPSRLSVMSKCPSD